MSLLHIKKGMSEGTAIYRIASPEELSMRLPELHTGVVLKIMGYNMTVCHFGVRDGKIKPIHCSIEEFFDGAPMLYSKQLTVTQAEAVVDLMYETQLIFRDRDLRRYMNILLEEQRIDMAMFDVIIKAINNRSLRDDQYALLKMDKVDELYEQLMFDMIED